MNSNPRRSAVFVFCLLFVSVLIIATACDDKGDEPTPVTILHPDCQKTTQTRTDAHTPQTLVADWGQPALIGDPINTLCPEDAIEISRDGHYLYFMFTEDRLEDMTPAQILAYANNTYRAERTGGPGEFAEAEKYDLHLGASGGTLDGELSFTADESKVYFHSNRAENTGYNANPFTNDYLDIYVADIVNGVPGPGRNLGEPVNSIYPDGEHAIHPDGVTLYFTSSRPGGKGGTDIYASTLSGDTWSTPENLDSINTLFNELQPCFTVDGDTMYFASERNPAIGPAIYRSVRSGGEWHSPELVIRGIVGEPSVTADGQLLYFVHVLTDALGTFDADIYYCERQ